jgi:ferredoxin
MVLYFSGTGNSQYVAGAIASITGDETLSINQALKADDRSSISSNRPFVIVAPSYCCRLPRVVDEFVLGRDLVGSNQAYLVLTCVETIGDASKYARRLCAAKGLEFLGMDAVVMPQNYIALYPMPNLADARAVIEAARPNIDRICDRIRNGQKLVTPTKLTKEKYLSGFLNDVFYAALVSAKGFRITDKCVGCGACAKLCPLNNVSIVAGTPKWGTCCTHCMACINGCPTAAIEYKKASLGRPRYTLAAALR